MKSDPASVKDETIHAASDSGLPGRFRQPGLLAPSEFEKVRIDLVDGAAIGMASEPGSSRCSTSTVWRALPVVLSITSAAASRWARAITWSDRFSDAGWPIAWSISRTTI